MNRTEKIQALENRLDALTASKPISLTEQLISEELENLRADIGNRVSTRAIEKIQTEFKDFSAKFQLEPVFSAISKADSENKKSILSVQKAAEKQVSTLLKGFNQLRKEDKNLSKEVFKRFEQEITSVRKSFTEETAAFRTRDSLLSAEVSRIVQDLERIDARFAGEITGTDAKEALVQNESLRKELSDLEKRVYSRIGSLNNHGGNMNRNMALNGNTSVLSRYTDINLKAGTNVTIAAVKNDTTKYTDITISASGGGGGFTLMIPVGAVNGTNRTFTFASAPSVVVLDNGNIMNIVSSDGTINWTGTDVITLSQAPNFNIYGF